MKSRRSALAATLMLATAGALTLIAPRPAAAQNFVAEVIMNGLNNPRGLAFGTGGALFVTEAGVGGNGPTIPGGEGPVSYGATGSVTRFLGGVQERVLTGLPSLAGAGGGGATGLHDIVFDSGGQAYGVIGLGADPSVRATLTTGGAPGGNFAQLVRLTVDGSNAAPVNVADLGTFEADNNPDGSTTPDTNPYGLITRTGGGFAVVDAGANTLLNVTNAGAISTLAIFAPADNPLFPNPGIGGPTYQAVPTSVAEAANGDLFVGQLTGFPFPAGGANIFRVPAAGGTPTVLADGFTNIIDLIVGDDGNIYVLQLTSNGLASQTGPGPGQLIRVDPLTGAKTVLLSDPLFFPGGITQGADGAFYVTNFGTAPGGGQVLRIVSTSAPEPGTLGLLALAGLPTLGAVVRRRLKRSA